MRINFVLPGMNLSGGNRVVLMFAEQLRRRGHQTFVVAAAPRAPTLKSRIRALVTGQGWLKTEEPKLGYINELGLKIDYRVLERFRPVEDRDLPDADVVVATWWLTAEWVAALAPAKGAKAYFIQHMETVFGQDVDRVHATWRLPMQKIVIAPWLADLARDQFGDPSAVVVKPGIDTELFNAPPRDKQPRPTVGFLYSPPLAFKGTRTALEVVSAVAKEVPDLLVRTFGTATLDPTAPLPPDAEFTRNPAQIALRSIYAACDVWLCSSTSEGFYLPSLEAMACRCPAVATKVGGLPAMVQEGVNGYLVDVGDTAAMADRLVRVLKADNADWRRMSEAAYETAMRYTWPEVTEGFERALESAIAHAAK